jgi:YD repeat-containing protein
MWGEAYSYDGIGNLTGKTVTQAPAPIRRSTLGS